MSAILMIGTCTVFLLAALYVDRRHSRIANAARHAIYLVERAYPTDLPADLLFHPGHTWVRAHSEDLVSIGTTDFASNFAGELVRIAVPDECRSLHQGDPAWTIVSARGRRLEQVMPIDGKVLAVNNELLGAADLVQRHPYDLGWILRVRPRDMHRSTLHLLSVAADRLWLEGIAARISPRLEPRVGQLLHDGKWVSGFGDHLNDEDWETLRQELFPSDKVLGKVG